MAVFEDKTEPTAASVWIARHACLSRAKLVA
jgi:hypothetical protein